MPFPPGFGDALAHELPIDARLLGLGLGFRSLPFELRLLLGESLRAALAAPPAAEAPSATKAPPAGHGARLVGLRLVLLVVAVNVVGKVVRKAARSVVELQQLLRI